MNFRDLATTLVCGAAFLIDPSLRVLLREDPRAQLETGFQLYSVVTLGLQYVHGWLT